MKADLCVLGCGSVGKNFLELLSRYEKISGIELNIKGITDISGSVILDDSNKIEEILKLEIGKISTLKNGHEGMSGKELIEETKPDIVVDMSPSDYKTGEPGMTHLKTAIDIGIDIVTSNKSPLALNFQEIMQEAKQNKISIGYLATVMAGTPLLELLGKGLYMRDLKNINGILNGTTNYILSTMHNEKIGFKQVFETAKGMGIVETNPALDIDGLDASAKMVIIANTLGIDMNINDVEIESLKTISLKDILESEIKGEKIKYLASLDISEERAHVRPESIPSTSKLSQVDGVFNAVNLDIEDDKHIYLEGPGAGGKVTAATVMTDIFNILRDRRC